MDFEEFFAGETDDFAPFQTPGELESPSPTLGRQPQASAVRV
jgi:hypothetical protein